jgi:acyl-CoA synthetase (AMP-forming)/AMP-acid ligase II
MSMDIAQRVLDYGQSKPDAPMMEWEGRWRTRRSLARFASDFEEALQRLGVEPLMAVAVPARNRPAHCLAVLSLLAHRRPISNLYAFQSAEALARDLTQTRFAALAIDADDWSEPVAQAAEASGTAVLVLEAEPDAGFRVIEPARKADPAAFHRLPAPGIEILSSGTTGPPKRIFHPAQRLFRSLEAIRSDGDVELGTVYWPLSGIGGSLALASSVIRGAPFLLFEKFTVETVVDAIKRHKLKTIPVTPTMVRMLYDANVPPEDLASLGAIYGGSGPIDQDLKDKFEARYGKPLIWAMGATEFCGTIVSWSVELYQEFGPSKRGSSGRALPGVTLRITDPETGAELGVGEVGRFEAKVDAMGPDWIRTTDRALIDADGFVYFKGRLDGAIIRGGFKIVPEKVCETLRLHPKVAEAALVGAPDDRLGQVPIAVVEPQPGAALTADELDRHLRAYLPAPQIPVRYILVDKLPYTASTKVNLAEVRKLAGI